MKTRPLLMAVLAAALQIGFLGWMIAGRTAILRGGHEVLLKVQPVDPRDLLRGDYVWLGYDISTIPASLIANRDAAASQAGERTIFVRLGRDADGYWRSP